MHGYIYYYYEGKKNCAGFIFVFSEGQTLIGFIFMFTVMVK